MSIHQRLRKNFPALVPYYMLFEGSPLNRRRKIRDGLAKMMLESRISARIEQFHPDASKEERDAIREDIVACTKKYHISPLEYFLYDFEKRSDSERWEFCPNIDFKNSFLYLNKWSQRRYFSQKSKTAEKFAKYFKRPVVALRLPRDTQKLEAFIREHKSVFVKSDTSWGGQGIHKIDVDESTDVEKIVAELVKEYCPQGHDGLVVAEKTIAQHEAMAKLHPQSVNTLRIITIKMKDRTVNFYPFIRVGLGDAFVDNGGAGGAICALDPETGVVVGAATEERVFYTEHPDTHEPLVGFRVPYYEQAVELAKELAEVVPQCRLVGWDLALTEDGWDLVEANTGPTVLVQIASQVGVRRQYEALLKELRIKL